MTQRKLETEDLLKIARSIVDHWEGVPDRAQAFIDKYAPGNEELRAILERDWRAMIGDEELYLASKQFVEDCEDTEVSDG